jgi:hypothetical protein
MNKTEEIIKSKLKSKEKVLALVKAMKQKEVLVKEFIEYIDYKAPRVKWGVPESIGNLAQKYPEEVGKAIPKLLINTKD